MCVCVCVWCVYVCVCVCGVCVLCVEGEGEKTIINNYNNIPIDKITFFTCSSSLDEKSKILAMRFSTSALLRSGACT